MLTKRAVVVAMILLLVVVLVGCAAPPAPTPTPAPTAKAAPQPTQTPAKKFKVAYIFPGVVNDGSYNSLGYNAMQAAQKALGFETVWNERVVPAESPRVMGEFASSGVDVVWAHSGTFMDPVMQIAANYPKVTFVTYVGVAQANAPKNVWQQYNLEGHREMFFLSGVMAGLMTKSNVIGFVGGVELTTYVEGLKSYEAGAKWVNPKVKLLKVWTGDFDDAPKAKEAAIGQIEQGADVLGHALNLGVYGEVEAIKARQGVYFIGKDLDQAPMLPDRTLLSMFINYEKAMTMLIPKIQAGEAGGFFKSQLADGTVTVTDPSAWVPDNIKTRYKAIKAKVVSKEIDTTIPADELAKKLATVPVP